MLRSFGSPTHQLPPLATRARRRFSEAARGQTLAEYGLALAAIAVLAVVMLSFIGPIVSRAYHQTGVGLCHPGHHADWRDGKDDGKLHPACAPSRR